MKRPSDLPPCPGKDVVHLGPEIAPGVRTGVRHRADHTSEAILFTEAEDGTAVPPGSELVRVGPGAVGGWGDVEVEYDNRSPSSPSHSCGRERMAGGDGPAQVATKEYREGYDRIFGKRAEVGLA